jgi:chloramphenicol O-acetyltransferase type A
MRRIKLETWPRWAHFKLYSSFEHPRFEISAQLDISAFYEFVKQGGISFTIATVYLISRAANAIPEFRQRIRGNSVVEHTAAHPSFTILVSEAVFSFCTVDYIEDFSVFETSALAEIERVKAELNLEDEPGRDDYLFMTAIPWIAFTSLRHPMPTHPGDSIPRFAWGKFYKDGDRLKMPLSVDAHHALVDGVHVGKFYNEVENILASPEVALGRG